MANKMMNDRDLAKKTETGRDLPRPLGQQGERHPDDRQNDKKPKNDKGKK